MTEHFTPPLRMNSSLPGATVSEPSRLRPLTIAIINNMPDSSLRATERHFCSLLGAASAGMVVDLKFYSLPGVLRGDVARAHVSRFYENVAELEAETPDGLIVTGAEPKSACLSDESFWRPLSRVIDWADEQAIPAIWSCLAAHAAVYHADGIERIPISPKLSGVFECRIGSERHRILHRVPGRWRVPHSRFNGLSRKSLEAHGYTILSWSREVGVDMFMKQGRALQLFLQGHPEYEAETLVAEYRRDIIRAARVGRGTAPEIPLGVGGRGGRLKWNGIADIVRSGGDISLLTEFNSMIDDLAPQDYWSFTAQRLFGNWLTYLDTRRRLSSIEAPGNRIGVSQIAAAHVC